MSSSDETSKLMERVRSGDKPAFEELFTRHRKRLLRLVRARMDARLAGRMDAADIVQETYMEAARRFEGYQDKSEMSGYLWLRWIAREKIIQQYRRHLGADKRAVDRERPLVSPHASAEVARELISPRISPTQEIAARELSDLMQQALESLEEEDRKVVIWRSFEQLSVDETAELLGISRAAAAKRYLRALEKLRKSLDRLGLLPGSEQ